MEDKKKTLTEYEKEISEAQEMEEANTHKRKVRSFKRMLMVTFLVVCAIPITLCMFLMVKMNRLDHRIENLVDRVEEGKNLVSTNIGLIDESTETMTSEQMAYGDLGKGSEGVHVALTDNGDGSNKTTDDAEATTEARFHIVMDGTQPILCLFLIFRQESKIVPVFLNKQLYLLIPFKLIVDECIDVFTAIK